MALSDTSIRNAKPGAKPVRMFDGGGLYLEVAPSGGKWWRLKYRHYDKEKRLSLGTYPEVGLKAARARRGAARKQIAEGIDDFFDLVLVQIKGGSARAPTMEDRRRLREVAKLYRARAVVQFCWRKGERATFSVLRRDLEWKESSGAEIFG